ncbi:hypothetical protein QJQ45_030031 [Haematococcus lacustris]|nr:hypothetical protein QJQ45_030031 [Haematococcus lacustris]
MLQEQLLHNLFHNGFNASLLAYGQTGSGKTHSMLGSPGTKEQKGIAQILLGRILAVPGVHSVRLAAFQVYKKSCHDLLAPTRSIEGACKFDEVKRANMFWAAVTEKEVQDEEQVEQLLAIVTERRTTMSTDRNALSSRSHLFIRVVVEFYSEAQHEMLAKQSNGDTTAAQGSPSPTQQQPHRPALRRAAYAPVLMLVDLAGSERSSKTQHISAGGQAQTNAINGALSSLRRVIGSLRENEKPSWRDDPLTKALKGFLGGDAVTHVLCTVSCEPSQVVESQSTLAFGEDIRVVHSKPTAQRVATLQGSEADRERVLRQAAEAKLQKCEEARQRLERDMDVIHSQLRKQASSASAGELSGLDTVSALRARLHQLQSQVQALQASLHSRELLYERQVAALTAGHEASEEELRAQLKGLIAERDVLQEQLPQLQDASAQLAGLSTQLAVLQSDHQQQAQLHAATLLELQAVRDQLQAARQQQQQQQQLGEVEAIGARQSLPAGDSSSQLCELPTQMSADLQAKMAVEERCESLQAEVAQQSGELASAKELMARQQVELERLTAERQDSVGNEGSRQVEMLCMQLQQELAAAMAAQQQQEQQLAEARAAQQQQEQQLAAAMAAQQQQEQQLAEARAAQQQQEQQLAAAMAAQQQREQQLAEARAAQQQQEQQLAAAMAAQQQQEQQLIEARAAQQQQEQQLAEARAAQQQQEQQLAAAMAAQQQQEQQLAEARAAQQQQEQQLAAAMAAQQQQEQQLIEARAAQQQQEQQLAEARAAQQQQEQQLAEARAAQQQQEQQLAEARAAQQQQEQQLIEARAAQQQQEQQLAEARAAQQQQEQQLAEARAAQQQQEQQLAGARAAQQQQEQQLAEARAAQQQQEQQLAAAMAAQQQQEQQLAAAMAAQQQQEQQLAAAMAAQQQQEQQLAEARAAQQQQEQQLAAAMAAQQQREQQLVEARATQQQEAAENSRQLLLVQELLSTDIQKLQADNAELMQSAVQSGQRLQLVHEELEAKESALQHALSISACTPQLQQQLSTTQAHLSTTQDRCAQLQEEQTLLHQFIRHEKAAALAVRKEGHQLLAAAAAKERSLASAFQTVRVGLRQLMTQQQRSKDGQQWQEELVAAQYSQMLRLLSTLASGCSLGEAPADVPAPATYSRLTINTSTCTWAGPDLVSPALSIALSPMAATPSADPQPLLHCNKVPGRGAGAHSSSLTNPTWAADTPRPLRSSCTALSTSDTPRGTLARAQSTSQHELPAPVEPPSASSAVHRDRTHWQAVHSQSLGISPSLVSPGGPMAYVGASTAEQMGLRCGSQLLALQLSPKDGLPKPVTMLGLLPGHSQAVCGLCLANDSGNAVQLYVLSEEEQARARDVKLSCLHVKDAVGPWAGQLSLGELASFLSAGGAVMLGPAVTSRKTWVQLCPVEASVFLLEQTGEMGTFCRTTHSSSSKCKTAAGVVTATGAGAELRPLMACDFEAVAEQQLACQELLEQWLPQRCSQMLPVSKKLQASPFALEGGLPPPTPSEATWVSPPNPAASEPLPEGYPLGSRLAVARSCGVPPLKLAGVGDPSCGPATGRTPAPEAGALPRQVASARPAHPLKEGQPGGDVMRQSGPLKHILSLGRNMGRIAAKLGGGKNRQEGNRHKKAELSGHDDTQLDHDQEPVEVLHPRRG